MGLSLYIYKTIRTTTPEYKTKQTENVFLRSSHLDALLLRDVGEEQTQRKPPGRVLAHHLHVLLEALHIKRERFESEGDSVDIGKDLKRKVHATSHHLRAKQTKTIYRYMYLAAQNTRWRWKRSILVDTKSIAPQQLGRTKPYTGLYLHVYIYSFSSTATYNPTRNESTKADIRVIPNHFKLNMFTTSFRQQ